MNAAATGFTIIAIAFPIYLLWKGELPGYLKLMAEGALTQVVGTTQNTTPIGGGSVPIPSVGGIPVPPIQTQAAPGTM